MSVVDYSDPLRHSRAELRSAANAISRMRATSDFGEFDEAWRQFLVALEKVWRKVERECEPVRNKFRPWQATINKVRSSDPLLSFLQQARNADEHSVQMVAEPVAPTVAIGAGPSGVGFIERLEVSEGRIVEYSGDAQVDEFGPRFGLCRVRNRGVVYGIPTEHLGKSIVREDPISLVDPIYAAEVALEFYAAFVTEAEKRFFSKGPK